VRFLRRAFALARDPNGALKRDTISKFLSNLTRFRESAFLARTTFQEVISLASFRQADEFFRPEIYYIIVIKKGSLYCNI
jgi:hypothetical protein